jgi:hypothetical protein
MKVGDLVKMKDWPYFEKWHGLTAIVHGRSTLDKSGTPLIDVCFIETGEVRLTMSASLFELISETLDS